MIPAGARAVQAVAVAVVVMATREEQQAVPIPLSSLSPPTTLMQHRLAQGAVILDLPQVVARVVMAEWEEIIDVMEKKQRPQTNIISQGMDREVSLDVRVPLVIVDRVVPRKMLRHRHKLLKPMQQLLCLHQGR
jgi:hypothetical protein